MEIGFGSLVISLDFELLWGVIDHSDISAYMENISGVRRVVPELLKKFQEYGIHATWGIVGMIANRNLNEWEENKPAVLPNYNRKKLSSYYYADELNKIEPSYLFASDLIDMISKTDNQEIGMHTYSHYYCCDEGQTKEAFDYDIKKEIEILSKYSSELSSLIFPRNQFNVEYSDILKANKIYNYRGNEKSWYYQPCSSSRNRQCIRRGLRLLDMYLNLSGNNCIEYSEIKDEYGFNNIRSSRLLRSYSKSLQFLEPIRIKRIKNQMRYAAKNNCIFHMWWHPHNFGSNTDKNMNNLESLLSYYLELKKEFDMKSLNMQEIGELLK